MEIPVLLQNRYLRYGPGSEKANINIFLCSERKPKALIRQHRCAGWSVLLLFACNKIKFSCKEVHIMLIGNVKLYFDYIIYR